MLEEPEEHLDEPPLPIDLRDHFRRKVKPVGLDHRAIDSGDLLRLLLGHAGHNTGVAAIAQLCLSSHACHQSP